MKKKQLFASAALMTCLATACSVVVKDDVAPRGIGAQCTSSDQCHAGACDKGICVASCKSDFECPEPTACFGGICQKRLKVAALWVGVVAGGEGWSLTHQEGMEETSKRLPYVSWYARENVLPFTGAIGDAVDEAVNKEKVDVVIANSFSQRDEILKKAEQYPNVKFLTCASYKSNAKNAASYGAHSEQAWWVAGRVAASKLGPNKRLGYVGSFITPEVVRHITTFYLGAKSIEPAVKLEVQWLGFWFDYKSPASYVYRGPLNDNIDEKVYREELLTYRLLEAGAEVIGHGTDNQRVVRLVERLTKQGKIRNVFTLSNDNRNAFRELTADQLPNGPPLQTCLGSPFWNWAPMYSDLLDQMHRGIWDPNVNRNDPMSESIASSVPGFNLNPVIGIDDSAVRSYVNEIAQRGWQYAFNGPYETTGQRDKDGDGRPDPVQRFEADEAMSDREYQSMCFFPKGVVEKSNVTDSHSLDVDARVPDGARAAGDPTFLSDIEGPPGAPPGVGIDCTKNL